MRRRTPAIVYCVFSFARCKLLFQSGTQSGVFVLLSSFLIALSAKPDHAQIVDVNDAANVVERMSGACCDFGLCASASARR